MSKPGTVVLAGLLALFALSASARELTLEQRVAAQESIDRVRHSHLEGARALPSAPARHAIALREVETYLRRSLALERFWRTPVTHEMLQRELQRMANGSAMPERLRELEAALGNDAFVIEECLARPALVERLARGFFESDARLHERALSEVDALRKALGAGSLDPHAERAGRAVLTIVTASASRPSTRAGIRTRELPRAEFDALRARLRTGAPGDVVSTRDALLVPVLLETQPDALRIALYRVPKQAWDAWWPTVAGTLDPAAVRAVAGERDALPSARGRSPGDAPCVPDDTWHNGSLDAIPDARVAHTVVWTGSEMIVWGGGSLIPTDTGYRYDPATDTWTKTSHVGAPEARMTHTAVWTGSRMIVWGGTTWHPETLTSQVVATGASYDPLTDTWETLPVPAGFEARDGHTAVWTGTRMLVWGGARWDTVNRRRVVFGTGASFDPLTNTWAPWSNAGAPAPRTLHTAVWTGDRLVVWGGRDAGDVPLGDGGRYDPAADSWAAVVVTGAPSGRSAHTAVWTGTRMIVWGGAGTDYRRLDTGAAYDPVADAWTPVSGTGAPLARAFHSAVWTGARMFVWGGSVSGTLITATGALYDPATDSWTPTSMISAPVAARDMYREATWTGSLALVWGGQNIEWWSLVGADTRAGGRYDPVTDSWTPMSTGSGPGPRASHTAVWDGSEMIVWGGVDGWSSSTNAGDRYDPVLDTWHPLSTIGAPSARSGHAAVWTGAEMLVWGGIGVDFLGHGGRYDPTTDSWSSMSILGEPSGRIGHTATWTGERLIVWGGTDEYGYTGTGAIYDPRGDRWTSVSRTGAPTARSGHVVAWTGNELIVWGGCGSSGCRGDGARFDGGTWRPLAASPLSPRADALAAWTGRELIVWGGGADDGGVRSDGARYDPARDTWTPMTTVAVPAVCAGTTAVWTGREMLFWGGFDGWYNPSDTGGRYDPQTDTWTRLSTSGRPVGRQYHSTVWTGHDLIVWGGQYSLLLASGGRYAVENALDHDGDGVSSCAGDVDDQDASVYPGAPEICDGKDNDGNGLVDDGAGAPAAIATVTLLSDARTIAWPRHRGTESFDVVRGDVSSLLASSGSFTNSLAACVASRTTSQTAGDPLAPATGNASYYLVRPIGCGDQRGTYDDGVPGQAAPRDASIAASASACP